MAALSSSSSSSSMSPLVDTRAFMARYHHPRNVAASSNKNSAYAQQHGQYRQKQVDEAIAKAFAGGGGNNPKKSYSKITVLLHNQNQAIISHRNHSNGPQEQQQQYHRILTLYHYHHHCLDILLKNKKTKKGRVIWFWRDWETATDERILKAAIAALDESWKNDTDDIHDGDKDHGTGDTTTMRKRPRPNGGIQDYFAVKASTKPTSTTAAETTTMPGETRKRAAPVKNIPTKKKQQQGDFSAIDIIDLVDKGERGENQQQEHGQGQQRQQREELKTGTENLKTGTAAKPQNSKINQDKNHSPVGIIDLVDDDDDDGSN